MEKVNHASADAVPDAKYNPPFVSLDAVRRATEMIFSTSIGDTEARREAMKTLEEANMHCTPEEYTDFYQSGLELSAKEIANAVERQPILYFYEAAFEKIKREMEATAPAPGAVILWHVYNMGYVVKTRNECFAIDLHHRRGEELIPQLDFLLVTHDHTDHHTERLLEGVMRAGKPVVSNFYPRGVPRPENPDPLEIGTAKIHTAITDHNPKLRRFVQTYEIELTADGRKAVIFSGGDSCDPGQFSIHSPGVDVFIVHPRDGLDVAEAQSVLNPRLTLISHLLEMGHRFDRFRWSYEIGFWEMARSRRNGRRCTVPLWGDRIEI